MNSFNGTWSLITVFTTSR